MPSLQNALIWAVVLSLVFVAALFGAVHLADQRHAHSVWMNVCYLLNAETSTSSGSEELDRSEPSDDVGDDEGDDDSEDEDAEEYYA